MSKERMTELQRVLNAESVQSQFTKALGSPKRASAFIADVISMSSNTKLLDKCEVNDIVKLCSEAALLNLSFARKQAYIIPFSDRGKAVPTFVISADGWRALALRTNQYIKIKSLTVYEGEIEYYNRFTDEIRFGERKSNKVVGYYASFTLANGMSQSTYWPLERMARHAKRYSPSIKGDKSITVEYLMAAANNENATGQGWTGVFNSMAQKTILTNLLRHEGYFSEEMEAAVRLESAFEAPSRNVEVATNANQSEVTEDVPYEQVDEQTGEVQHDEDGCQTEEPQQEAAPKNNKQKKYDF